MTELRLKSIPVMNTAMLVRRPVAEVFEALVDPAITTKFWFTHSTGRLETDARVKWSWEMYGVSADVTVKAVDPGKRIVIVWPGHSGPTTVEWTFDARETGRS